MNIGLSHLILAGIAGALAVRIFRPDVFSQFSDKATNSTECTLLGGTWDAVSSGVNTGGGVPQYKCNKPGAVIHPM